MCCTISLLSIPVYIVWIIRSSDYKFLGCKYIIYSCYQEKAMKLLAFFLCYPLMKNFIPAYLNPKQVKISQFYLYISQDAKQKIIENEKVKHGHTTIKNSKNT